MPIFICYTYFVAKTKKDDIIKFDLNRTVANGVHIIGRIDREIYRCVTENIVTDEVIITDERIQHIKLRHPNDFEKYCDYMNDIVTNPEYIIETNKPNTALILKSFF